MKSVLIFIFAVILRDASAFPTNTDTRKLTQYQIDRIKTWTEDDKENIWELSGQFEGDIVLRSNQRNGIVLTEYWWENNEIPYELDPIFDEDQVAWIKQSLEEFTEKTCLTVRERTEDDVDYVYVTGEDSGCWSYVGRQGGRQELNLQRTSLGVSCFRSGTIVHEFLHVAGFFHQQSDSERDDYIEIVWDNIQEGTEENFEKYNNEVVTSFGQPYDYGSVLHYSAYAFSINGERTIITLDPDAEIGQRIEMSEIDANKVNLVYCPERV